MSIDFSIFSKQELRGQSALAKLGPWDLFISAYNTSDRVRAVYDHIASPNKVWIIHHEYGLSANEYPSEYHLAPVGIEEASFVKQAFDAISAKLGRDLSALSICIDITGIMRPHLLALLRYCEMRGITAVDFLYAEPARYIEKEKTAFADGSVRDVRQVQGYEGIIDTDTSRDMLVIGMGYDHDLIAEVAEDKDKAEKIQLFGFPPLRADMYQESVLRSYLASNSLGGTGVQNATRFFAPANDPFVTAQVLSDIVHRKTAEINPTNIYLAPLGTKAQALGFGIFALAQGKLSRISVIFPFSEKYDPETSEGVGKIWLYKAELPLS